MKTWITKSGYKIIQVISGRSNVFLLTDGARNILVDTSVSRLWNKLQKQLQKLKINSIDRIILTHSHFDHAANAKRIKEKFKASVIIHKKEAEYLIRGDNAPTKGTNFLTFVLINILGRFKIASLLKFEPCVPDIIFDHSYDLRELGFNACLIHTPGHTAGSICLIIDDEIVIAGDTMFGVFRGSIFPPFAEDTGLMTGSWGKLLETNCLYFLPSHGKVKDRSIVQKCYKPG